MLRKSSLNDLESGITLASDAIEKHKIDAKLYLLRAKLSFKLVSFYYTRSLLSSLLDV